MCCVIIPWTIPRLSRTASTRTPKAPFALVVKSLTGIQMSGARSTRPSTTMEIRAVEVTDSSLGDAPMLPGLLPQIPADEPIARSLPPLGIHASHDPAGQRMAPMMVAPVPHCGEERRGARHCA